MFYFINVYVNYDLEMKLFGKGKLVFFFFMLFSISNCKCNYEDVWGGGFIVCVMFGFFIGKRFNFIFLLIG